MASSRMTAVDKLLQRLWHDSRENEVLTIKDILVLQSLLRMYGPRAYTNPEYIEKYGTDNAEYLAELFN